MTEPDRIVILAGQDVAGLPGDHLLRGTTDHYKRELIRLGLLGVDAPIGKEYDLTVIARVASGIVFPGVCWGGADVGDYPPVDRAIQVLFRLGVELGLPILGICGGAHQIVTAAGGRLVAVEGHCPSAPGYRDVTVTVAEAANLSPRELHEQEMHTLGVADEDQLGAGLRGIGWAPDGMVEMFRLSDPPALAKHLGVAVRPDMWLVGAFTHPEMARDHPLLQAFAEACRAGR